jgi:hypothetical protein
MDTTEHIKETMDRAMESEIHIICAGLLCGKKDIVEKAKETMTLREHAISTYQHKDVGTNKEESSVGLLWELVNAPAMILFTAAVSLIMKFVVVFVWAKWSLSSTTSQVEKHVERVAATSGNPTAFLDDARKVLQEELLAKYNLEIETVREGQATYPLIVDAIKTIASKSLAADDENTEGVSIMEILSNRIKELKKAKLLKSGENFKDLFLTDVYTSIRDSEWSPLDSMTRSIMNWSFSPAKVLSGIPPGRRTPDASFANAHSMPELRGHITDTPWDATTKWWGAGGGRILMSHQIPTYVETPGYTIKGSSIHVGFTGYIFQAAASFFMGATWLGLFEKVVLAVLMAGMVAMFKMATTPVPVALTTEASTSAAVPTVATFSMKEYAKIFGTEFLKALFIYGPLAQYVIMLFNLRKSGRVTDVAETAPVQIVSAMGLDDPMTYLSERFLAVVGFNKVVGWICGTILSFGTISLVMLARKIYKHYHPRDRR